MAVVHGADRPQVIELPNGERVTPMFSAAEMERRLSKLRTLMGELGLDATLFTSYHNVNYYADFLYCSFGRPYGLAVTADGRRRSRRTSTTASRYRRTFGDNLVYTDWQRDNYFRAVVKALPAGVRRLGVEFDHLTFRARDKLETCPSGRRARRRRRGLHGAADGQVGGGDRGDPRRRGTADIGGAAVVEAIGEGVPEHEVALARDTGDGARDRQALPPRRADGHLGLVPVGDQHRRRPQPGHQRAGWRRATSSA